MQLFSLKPLKSGTESHNWKWLFTELADGLWRVSSQSSSALEYVPPSPIWFVCNDEWHGGAASDARDLGPWVIRNAWRRSLLIRAHSCWKNYEKKVNFWSWNRNGVLNSLRVIRTNLRDHVRRAIERVLLVQERDLLRCTNDDSTIPLFPRQLISPAKWMIKQFVKKLPLLHTVTPYSYIFIRSFSHNHDHCSFSSSNFHGLVLLHTRNVAESKSVAANEPTPNLLPLALHM